MKNPFKPRVREKKEVLGVTINSSLMQMLKEIMEGYDVNISTAVSEVLEHFKEQWDSGSIPKTKEEEDKEG